MSEPIIRLPRPMPHQLPLLLSPARHKLAACGRRWGKTAMGLLAALRGHGAYRGQRRGAIDGANVWWVAPTYGVAAKIWRDLKRACQDGWTAKSEAERRIELPGGGSVTVRSADRPDTLRGEGLDGLVLDEAAFLAPAVWHEALRPSLSDRRGWAMLISTPNGRNWFYEAFQQAATQKDWQRWQLPSRQNPLLSDDELAAARAQIGLRPFEQEYEARFVETQGAEFSGDYFSDAIWFDHWPQASEQRLRVVALDPSKGASERSDYSAFVLLAIDWQGGMWVDARLGRFDVCELIEEAIRLSREFSPDAFGVETNQFQEVLAEWFYERSRLQGATLPLYHINNRENKRTRIRATLTPHLARGAFRFLRSSPGARLLVDQLTAFPEAQHDDGPDALEMAVRLARQLMEGGETPERIEMVVAD